MPVVKVADAVVNPWTVVIFKTNSVASRHKTFVDVPILRTHLDDMSTRVLLNASIWLTACTDYNDAYEVACIPRTSYNIWACG